MAREHTKKMVCLLDQISSLDFHQGVLDFPQVVQPFIP
jgi:hypothetical protein